MSPDFNVKSAMTSKVVNIDMTIVPSYLKENENMNVITHCA